jgi:hypothetical protein
MVNFDHDYGTLSVSNFTVKFKSVTREIMNYRDEVLFAAKSIAENTDKPIYLGMSGGIDSEVIALCLKEQNIDFTAVVVEHSNGANMHDVGYAYKFCNQHNIKIERLLLDVDTFFTTGIFRYIDQGYRAVRMFRYFQLFLIEHIENKGGCLILGSGEQVYCTVDNKINMMMDQGYTMSLDWCKNHNTVHYPYFFMYNPEMYASYIKIDLIELLLEQPQYFTNFKDNKSTEKMLVLHSIWDMERRNKFHGFEKIIPLKQKVESSLRERFPDIQTKFFPISTIKKELGI